MIRLANPNDLRAVVRVHQQAFPGFLMTELGPAFLRAYYQTVMDYSHPILLVYEGSSGALEGFAAGFMNPPQFYKRLKERRWQLAFSAGLHLMLRPARWRRVLASRHRAYQLAHQPAEPTATAELASLGVLPQSQGKGIGRQLVLAFLETAQAKGASRVILTTDAQQNDSVNRFYQRLGFQLRSQYWHSSTRLMNLYEYNFSGKDALIFSPTRSEPS